jgi:hypothetical protein
MNNNFWMKMELAGKWDKWPLARHKALWAVLDDDRKGPLPFLCGGVDEEDHGVSFSYSASTHHDLKLKLDFCFFFFHFYDFEGMTMNSMLFE